MNQFSAAGARFSFDRQDEVSYALNPEKRVLITGFAAVKVVTAKIRAGNSAKKTDKGQFDRSNGRLEIDFSKAAKEFDFMDLMAGIEPVDISTRAEKLSERSGRENFKPTR